MKIAFLTLRRDPHDRRSWRSWSGSIYHMGQALQKHCGEVSYFSPVLPCKKEELIERIIRAGSRVLLKKKYSCSFFLANSYAKVASRWLAGQSFDVIVAPDGALDIALLETNIPIVLIGDATFGLLFDYYPRFSDFAKRSIYELNTIQDLALKKASAVIYSSPWAARSAIEDYGADPAKIHVIPFGANFDKVPRAEITQEKKKSGRCRLLFMGTEWERKGGDIAIETLLKLEEMGISSELTVCGTTPPKGVAHERMTVIPFLDKNNESQSKEIEKLFAISDFLLLPTRADCAPNVFREANAFGLPVITTNTGGISGIIQDEENGFMLPYAARGAAYAELIARIYRDDAHYAELVRASRAAFEERLNWDAWGVAVKQVLTKLLGYENSFGDSHISIGL